MLGDHVNVFLSSSRHILEAEIMVCTIGSRFQACRRRPQGLSQFASNKSGKMYRPKNKYEIDKQTTDETYPAS